jgi:hypothetical protein
MNLPTAKQRKGEKSMSRMSDMDLTIKSLRDAATAIAEAADYLTKAFSDTADESAAPQPEPEKEPEKPTLTLVDVRTLLAKKSRAGHTAEVKALLQKYGASRLSDIDPANYEALVHDAEGLADD